MRDDAAQGRPEPSLLSLDAEDYFCAHAWCLNPVLTFRGLLVRLDRELECIGEWKIPWQREESRINLYLLSCAISCTADDYLSRPRWHFTPLEKFFPNLRTMIRVGERILNLPPRALNASRLSELWQWKTSFDTFVESVCRLLLSPQDPPGEILAGIRSDFDRLRSGSFPDGLLKARMRLNEGYRCQDLSHHDVIALADRFLGTVIDRDAAHVVVGARTAGSYFSPLLKVYLEQQGIRKISWTTVRPRFGAHGMEHTRLKHLLAPGTRVILTDDYSNTGQTLRMLEDIVRSFDIPPRDMIALTPIHPARSNRHIPLSEGARVIMIGHDDLQRAKAMEPGSVEALLKRFRLAEGAREVLAVQSRWAEAVNRELWSHYADGFQVRLKRVYEVTIRRHDGSEEKKKILAKSVGLGWLGYHAYLTGLALGEYVPRVIGLGDGIIFLEWLEGRPLTLDDITSDVLERVSSYIAARATRLGLGEDPRSEEPYLSWGWMEILRILRQAYGRLAGYLKADVLLDRLKRAVQFRPSLVDGRVRPEEWRVTENGIFKLDFEQHCFGAPELDVVDPAYDIAITSYEFALAESDEARMLEFYANRTGDADGLKERVLLYKLLYATAEAERAHTRILAGGSPAALQRWFERLLWSWNLRVYTMNRFCSELVPRSPACVTPSGLYVLDIDGVFDSEVFGFPHTTVNGLEAIALLQSEGLAVLPNTGRSCEHVREYCRNLGLQAGIAEYGSAIVDMEKDDEIPLVGREVLEELSRCREALHTLDGVFIDPGYRFSVRALRFRRNGPTGLTRKETDGLIARHGFRNLKTIQRKVDTYFVGKETDKGRAMIACRNRIWPQVPLVAAIGNSNEDVPMLERAPFAYAPSNCSTGIRNLAAVGRCAILQGSCQTGLLQAVRELLRLNGGKRGTGLVTVPNRNSVSHLMFQLLAVADLPLFARIMAALSRNSLL